MSSCLGQRPFVGLVGYICPTHRCGAAVVLDIAARGMSINISGVAAHILAGPNHGTTSWQRAKHGNELRADNIQFHVCRLLQAVPLNLQQTRSAGNLPVKPDK